MIQIQLKFECYQVNMPRRRQQRSFEQVGDFERGRIVGMRESGLSLRDIAARLTRSISTISRIWRQWVQIGAERRQPGSGARRRTTTREDRHLIRLSLQGRFQSASILARQWWTVTRYRLSVRRIRHRLSEFGLHARRALLRLPLTARHRSLRLAWCRERRLWNNEWDKIVFSDESRFCLYQNDSRVLVRRRRGERGNVACIRTRHTAPTQGIMVWGAISYNWKSRLIRLNDTVNSQRYIDEILLPEIVPHIQVHPAAIFQQDNARPHVARRVLTFFNQHRIPVLPWPARSPDLSPIENLWDVLGRAVRRIEAPIQNVEELWAVVERAWNEIPQNVIRHLIQSMPRRVETVIRARGGHSSY